MAKAHASCKTQVCILHGLKVLQSPVVCHNLEVVTDKMNIKVLDCRYQGKTLSTVE